MSETIRDIVRVRARITGRVQGVFYRQTTREQAQALGLNGWVRNMADGTVEMEAVGPQDKVDLLMVWCHKGPPRAKVDAVEIISRDQISQLGEQVTGFEITG